MSHVTIIGAGIVGSCTARFLQRAGYETTLVDRVEPGLGCSFGNAGVIATVASSIQPPGPRLLRQVAKMVFDRQAAFTLRGSYLPRFAPWLIALLRGCTTAKQRRTAEAMAGLLAGTTSAYDTITRATEADRYMRRNGSLGLYRTQEAFEADAWRREINAALGGDQESLSTAELRQMEPSFTDEIQYAVYNPNAYSTDNPYELTRAIAHQTVESGGEIVQTEVSHIRVENARASTLITDKGEMRIDELVIAGGAYSGRLTAMMGIKTLIDTERGYHVEVTDTQTRLTRPGIHYEHAYGVNPMTTGLRIAGTVEFAGLDAPEDLRRAQMIWHRARPAIREIADADESKLRYWMGRRPTLPDYRPVIGAAPGLRNCWLNFGHQHLGLTLAARTGEIIGELVAGRDPGLDLEPFRLDRF